MSNDDERCAICCPSCGKTKHYSEHGFAWTYMNLRDYLIASETIVEETCPNCQVGLTDDDLAQATQWIRDRLQRSRYSLLQP